MKKFIRSILPTAVVLLGFAIVCLCIHLFVFHTVRVEGTSMVDTLRSGDIVLVTRFDYMGNRQPQRGTIVECSFPNRNGTYIKRVIGLPGDRIEIINSRTYVNGEAFSEPYATGPSEDYSTQLGTDEYLVLGDNRAQSYDSRAEDMGFISNDNLLGRVRLVLWPFKNVD